MTNQVPPTSDPSGNQSMRFSDWLRIIVPVGVVGAILIFAWQIGYFELKDQSTLNAAASRVEVTPWLGLAFFIVYAILAAIAAPISPLAYVAGAIFGPVMGTLYVWLASTLGAALGYWLARTIWSEPAHRLLGRYRGILVALRDTNHFLIVLRVQLLPLVPFGIFNYAAGVTRLSFVPFLLGTAVGVLPGSAVAVYVGDRILAGIEGSDTNALVVAAGLMVGLLALSFVPKLLEQKKPKAVDGAPIAEQE